MNNQDDIVHVLLASSWALLMALIGWIWKSNDTRVKMLETKTSTLQERQQQHEKDDIERHTKFETLQNEVTKKIDKMEESIANRLDKMNDLILSLIRRE